MMVVALVMLLALWLLLTRTRIGLVIQAALTHPEAVEALGHNGGLAAMAKMRKVTVVQGDGSFADPHHLSVAMADGKTQTIKFKNAIIAAGSEAVKLPFLPADDRIVTSTGALQLRQQPKRMLVIGGGIIGLEMGTVYSTLGAKLDVVEMLDGVMQGADRDLVKVWQKMNAPRFDKLMLKTKTVGAEATADGIRVMFEGLDGTKSEGLYDLVLQAVGRTPNGKKIGADKAGVIVGDRGFIPVDVQMRTNVPHIFAIGDIVGQPMLAHKAVHEAHVAAEVAAGDSKAQFDARVIPSVAYTDPEVAWVGLTEDEAKARGIKVRKGLFPWTASGRAIANGRDEGFTKLLFDDSPEAHGHGRILGGGIVGTHAGDMIGRDRPGHRDGRRRGGHRQDHPPASHAGRKHRHGRGSGPRQLHRPAAGTALNRRRAGATDFTVRFKFDLGAPTTTTRTVRSPHGMRRRAGLPSSLPGRASRSPSALVASCPAPCRPARHPVDDPGTGLPGQCRGRGMGRRQRRAAVGRRCRQRRRPGRGPVGRPPQPGPGMPGACWSCRCPARPTRPQTLTGQPPTRRRSTSPSPPRRNCVRWPGRCVPCASASRRCSTPRPPSWSSGAGRPMPTR